MVDLTSSALRAVLMDGTHVAAALESITAAPCLQPALSSGQVALLQRMYEAIHHQYTPRMKCEDQQDLMTLEQMHVWMHCLNKGTCG